MTDKKLVMFMASGGKIKKKMAAGGLSDLAGAMDSGMRLRAALASPTREKMDTAMAGSVPARASRMPSALPRRRGRALPVASAEPLIGPPPMGGGFMRK